MKGHVPSTFSMTAPTTLSVLVPAYNEQYLVYASLERMKILAESPLLEGIEVIIVDDGSTDQTPSVLGEFERSISAESDAKMKWVRLVSRMTSSYCRNLRRPFDTQPASSLKERRQIELWYF